MSPPSTPCAPAAASTHGGRSSGEAAQESLHLGGPRTCLPPRPDPVPESAVSPCGGSGPGGLLPRYMTCRDVARHLGISPSRVQAWVERGELVGVCVSISATSRRRQYRIAREALELFIEGRSTRPRPSTPAPRRSGPLRYKRIV